MYTCILYILYKLMVSAAKAFFQINIKISIYCLLKEIFICKPALLVFLYNYYNMLPSAAVALQY